MKSLLIFIATTLLASACSASEPLLTPTPSVSNLPSPTASSCAATDQDQYIYHPSRLAVQAACVRVTGTVLILKPEADGDLHIRVQLDPEFAFMLTSANQQQCAQGVCGLLVVEPVCVGQVTQSDAVSTCAADPDPIASLPPLNAHVWLEGRYVLDNDHGGWAELHPLYRWGPA